MFALLPHWLDFVSELLSLRPNRLNLGLASRCVLEFDYFYGLVPHAPPNPGEVHLMDSIRATGTPREWNECFREFFLREFARIKREVGVVLSFKLS